MAEVLLHGLILPDTPRPANAPAHERLACDGMTALITSAPPDLRNFGPDQMAEAALAHHALLQDYCQFGPVLPTRFGTLFSAPELVAEHLTKQSQDFRAALETLVSMKEYTVRLSVITHPDLPKDPLPSGRAFLARGRDQKTARAAVAARRAALRQDLTAALQAIAFKIEPAAASRPDRLMDLALLLPADSVPDLTALGPQFGAEAQALCLDLRITGPWPAYSFHLPMTEVGDGA